VIKLNKEEKLSRYFKDSPGIITKNNRFTRTIRKVITNWMLAAVVPWLAYCLQKYSEQDFHTRMDDPSFDFLADWKTFHLQRYNTMLKIAKRWKGIYELDVNEVLDLIVKILNKESGWTVYPWEKLKLLSTIMRVKNEIDD
jgi:hypothetical protein